MPTFCTERRDDTYSRRVKRVLVGWALLSGLAGTVLGAYTWENRLRKEHIEEALLLRVADIQLFDIGPTHDRQTYLDAARETNPDQSHLELALGLQRGHLLFFSEAMPAFREANLSYESELDAMPLKNRRAFFVAFRWWASSSLGALAAALALLLGMNAWASLRVDVEESART